MNIIGDVAGEYVALMRLVKRMQKDDKEGFIFVGDLVDRGKDSLKVVEWVRKNAKAVMGNHEHMMIDYHDAKNLYGNIDQNAINQYPWMSEYLGKHWWIGQGGAETLKSYGKDSDKLKEHAEYLKSLPVVTQHNDYIISHAPLLRNIKHEDIDSISDVPANQLDEEFVRSQTWNRNPSRPIKNKIQIHGHNSKIAVDTTAIAICIDSSSEGYVNGFSTITDKMYREPHDDMEQYNEENDKMLNHWNDKIKKAITRHRQGNYSSPMRISRLDNGA
jgi:hypothetical protein